ncbi:hypothetical protein ACFQ3N_15800 [Virgibacillus byunsanensis]|uniref:Uncharacterized protein n=1 Tax=Virgibacillus byunsanensis TaxID=570945 RepID=A0ABW3LQC9_9BACI
MEAVTYYDHSFNLNEWFVIISTVGLSIIVWKLPKIFSRLESIAYYLYGVFTGMFFDHTISVAPLDYYDVNDNSSYEFIDFISYIMYGPFSYIFIYFYVKFNINGYKHIVYIVIWTAISILVEWISVKVGLFHYKQGYTLFYSIPIYLFVQTLQVVIYNVIQHKSRRG